MLMGLVICVLALALWALRGVRGFVSDRVLKRSGAGAMRILDVCSIDPQRRLVFFTSPFGQGIVLLSPRGDQLSLLPASADADDAVVKVPGRR